VTVAWTKHRTSSNWLFNARGPNRMTSLTTRRGGYRSRRTDGTSVGRTAGTPRRRGRSNSAGCCRDGESEMRHRPDEVRLQPCSRERPSRERTHSRTAKSSSSNVAAGPPMWRRIRRGPVPHKCLIHHARGTTLSIVFSASLQPSRSRHRSQAPGPSLPIRSARARWSAPPGRSRRCRRPHPPPPFWSTRRSCTFMAGFPASSAHRQKYPNATPRRGKN